MKKSRHILIIWGDDNQRSTLATLLRMHEYSVTHSGDAFHGLNMIEKNEQSPFSLVIIGPGPSTLDSWEVVPLVRSKYSKEDLPIIFVTTKPKGDEQEDLRKTGTEDLINVLLRQINNNVIYKNIKGLIG